VDQIAQRAASISFIAKTARRHSTPDVVDRDDRRMLQAREDLGLGVHRPQGNRLARCRPPALLARTRPP
jgi:hypothetical protein